MQSTLQVLSEDPIENVAKLGVECWQCGTVYVIVVDLEGYLSWLYEGKLLQHALPQNTHDERELLLTGTCGKCYDELFNLGEEE